VPRSMTTGSQRNHTRWEAGIWPNVIATLNRRKLTEEVEEFSGLGVQQLRL
jgi:hypothetical protein